MSFKIKITNNESGEVLVNEENAVAVIGALAVENGTAEIGFCACNTFDVCRTLSAAKKSINRIENTDKQIAIASELFGILDKKMKVQGAESNDE